MVVLWRVPQSVALLAPVSSTPPPPSRGGGPLLALPPALRLCISIPPVPTMAHRQRRCSPCPLLPRPASSSSGFLAHETNFLPDSRRRRHGAFGRCQQHDGGRRAGRAGNPPPPLCARRPPCPGLGFFHRPIPLCGALRAAVLWQPWGLPCWRLDRKPLCSVVPRRPLARVFHGVVPLCLPALTGCVSVDGGVRR